MRGFSWWVDRITGAVKRIGEEIHAGYKLTDDTRSFVRFAADTVLCRAHVFVPLRWLGGDRCIRVRGGVQLHYRLDRGDLFSSREVWIDECYRLPQGSTPKYIIDLGANIGVTSLWFAKNYAAAKIIAVEPSPDNARITRLNFETNGVPGEVVEAAIGPEDGTILFNEGSESNVGRVSEESGKTVRMVSMETVLGTLPTDAAVDVVKIDIEGSESRLLATNIGWLDRVRSLVMEFHLAECDRPKLLEMFVARGFKHIPRGGSSDWTTLDEFIRP
jgi:FkbM family methyltransferase